MNDTDHQPGAPESWLEKHGDALYSFAFLRLGKRELAEDIVQDTLLAAIGAKGEFQAKSSVRTWLIGILKRKIVDHFRREEVRRKHAEKTQAKAETELEAEFFRRNGSWLEGVGRYGSDPSAVMQQREFWRIFLACRNKLPPKLRNVFILREIEGESQESICSTLDISPTNLSVRLYRARMHLRRCLELNWFQKQDS